MDESLSANTQSIPFRSPKRFLGDLDYRTTAQIIASAADVALVLDDGIIQDVALAGDYLAGEGYERSWRGKSWIETVTVESRAKIEALLEEAPSRKRRWRQVNHPAAGGVDIPIRYTALRAGSASRVLAIGRDLRSVSTLQQRLVEAHQNLERDHSSLREAEARYRLLFQSVAQPVIVVRPDTMEIEEINAAAARVFGDSIEGLTGALLDTGFTTDAKRAVAATIAEADATGTARTEGLSVVTGVRGSLVASSFRERDALRVILRFEPDVEEMPAPEPRRDEVLRVLESLPDALVVTETDLQIVAANQAFLTMTQIARAEHIVGSPLYDHLGRSRAELNVMTSSIESHGSVRNFATVMRDRFGGEEAVEVSAVLSPSEERNVLGFSIRNVSRRLSANPKIARELPTSVDQLTGLVGRVPLKEIVRESTDFIEQLCVEAALEITEGNRASAAEILGLSRQGLYSKLRRFQSSH